MPDKKPVFRFKALIHKVPDIDGAYIIFPHDLRETFGKGRVKVAASFDGHPYQGCLVYMGLPTPILGIPQAIRRAIAKQPGDSVDVVIQERE